MSDSSDKAFVDDGMTLAHVPWENLILIFKKSNAIIIKHPKSTKCHTNPLQKVRLFSKNVNDDCCVHFQMIKSSDTNSFWREENDDISALNNGIDPRKDLTRQELEPPALQLLKMFCVFWKKWPNE